MNYLKEKQNDIRAFMKYYRKENNSYYDVLFIKEKEINIEIDTDLAAQKIKTLTK